MYPGLVAVPVSVNWWRFFQSVHISVHGCCWKLAKLLYRNFTCEWSGNEINKKKSRELSGTLENSKFSPNLSAILRTSNLGKFAYIWHFQQIGINAIKFKFEKTRIHFKSDVLAAVAVVDAKALNSVSACAFTLASSTGIFSTSIYLVHLYINLVL